MSRPIRINTLGSERDIERWSFESQFGPPFRRGHPGRSQIHVDQWTSGRLLGDRLIFVTAGKYTATSTHMDYYNCVVNSEANDVWQAWRL
jgi:hypothetical protein